MRAGFFSLWGWRVKQVCTKLGQKATKKRHRDHDSTDDDSDSEDSDRGPPRKRHRRDAQNVKELTAAVRSLASAVQEQRAQIEDQGQRISNLQAILQSHQSPPAADLDGLDQDIDDVDDVLDHAQPDDLN